MRGVSARREGRGMGQPAQQVWEYLLDGQALASMGEIYGIFWEGLKDPGPHGVATTLVQVFRVMSLFEFAYFFEF